jgi:hypothetical protein
VGSPVVDLFGTGIASSPELTPITRKKMQFAKLVRDDATGIERMRIWRFVIRQWSDRSV